MHHLAFHESININYLSLGENLVNFGWS